MTLATKKIESYPIDIQQQIWVLGWIPLTMWDQMICDLAVEKKITLVDAAVIQVKRLSSMQRWADRGVKRVK